MSVVPEPTSKNDFFFITDSNRHLPGISDLF